MWFSTITNWSCSFTYLNIDIRETNNYVTDLKLFQRLLTATTGEPDFTVESQAYCLKPRNAKELGTEKAGNFWRCLIHSKSLELVLSPPLASESSLQIVSEYIYSF